MHVHIIVNNNSLQDYNKSFSIKFELTFHCNSYACIDVHNIWSNITKIKFKKNTFVLNVLFYTIARYIIKLKT